MLYSVLRIIVTCVLFEKIFFVFFIRFNTYKEHTMPIIQHYEKLDLVKRIPAARSPDQVGFSTLEYCRKNHDNDLM